MLYCISLQRGWATWTTTAMDPKRVIAQAPLVLPLLNFRDVSSLAGQLVNNFLYHNQQKTIKGTL